MPDAETKRPNVIWIMSDQLRAQALGYRGDQNVCTPNIDNLAREGMRFDCAVAGSPWCTPFRASLLTGTYPHQNGCTKTPSALDPSKPTVAKAFKDAGYHTAYFGKWHLHGSNEGIYVEPEARGGFDHWLGFENSNAHFHSTVHGTGHEDGLQLEGYETDELTDLMIRHLREVRDQPFFSVLSVTPPHDPYLAPPAFHRERNPANIKLRPNVPDVKWIRDRFTVDLAGYYAMIENLDDNVGRLRDELRDLEIDRDTYLVFFSDHGDCLGSHGQQQKSSPWEESIRIPFIVGRANARHNLRLGNCDAPLNHVDIAPTSLGLCGIDTPDWMVGHDYSARCLCDAPPVDPATEPDSAYLQQIPAKQMRHSVNRPWRGIVTRDGWKYACMPGQDWLMFHVDSDPYEQANYVFDTAYADQRRRLHGMLSDWIARTGDDFEMPAIEPPR